MRVITLGPSPSHRLVYLILNPELCHDGKMTMILKQVNVSH
jgi:hypothetical protein